MTSISEQKVLKNRRPANKKGSPRLCFLESWSVILTLTVTFTSVLKIEESSKLFTKSSGKYICSSIHMATSLISVNYSERTPKGNHAAYSWSVPVTCQLRI